MPRTPKHRTKFAQRLHDLRVSRGITQIELAKKIKSSQRMISHYETDIENPSVDMVLSLSKALRVSTDELLGVVTLRKIEEEPSLNPSMKRYWKRVKVLVALPERDQKSILRMLDNTIKAHHLEM